MRNWYYYTWLCGDHIVEQHIHNLDVANWIKGDHPVTLLGHRRAARSSPTNATARIFDHHCVQYEYADGSRMYSECRHQPNTWQSVTEHAIGTKGTANVSGCQIKSGSDEVEVQSRRPVERRTRWSTTTCSRPSARTAPTTKWRTAAQHADGHHGTHGDLLGQGGRLGRRLQLQDRPDAGTIRLGRGSAIDAAGRRQLCRLPSPA